MQSLFSCLLSRGRRGPGSGGAFALRQSSAQRLWERDAMLRGLHLSPA